MPNPHLDEHVTILEQKVESLESLPSRVAAVELHIVQLREEMHAGFSALREEMQSLGGTLRMEIRAGDEALRNDLRSQIRASVETLRTELRAEIRNGDDETRRYMRVLHEEVISRLATIQEGRRRPKKQ